jgi:hypothetical protein
VQQYNPSAVDHEFPTDQWQSPAWCGPNGGNCVQVNMGANGIVGLRDSKLSDEVVLVFDDEEWKAFLAAARAGQFDR